MALIGEIPNSWPVANQVLVLGLTDELQAREIYGVCLGKVETDRLTSRSLAIGVITELILGGDMVPLQTSDRPVGYWDCAPAEVVARVVESWHRDAPDGPPPLGAVVWLELTEKGEARAIEIVNASDGLLEYRPPDAPSGPSSS
jgi:hypothetical protein